MLAHRPDRLVGSAISPPVTPPKPKPKPKPTSVAVTYWNVNVMRNTTTRVLGNLASLQTDLAWVCETGITHETNVQSLLLEASPFDMSMVAQQRTPQPRSVTAGYGLAWLTRRSIHRYVRFTSPGLRVASHPDAGWSRIKYATSKGVDNILVGGVYHPPRISGLVSFRELLSHLSAMINEATLNGIDKLLIGGDFNCHITSSEATRVLGHSVTVHNRTMDANGRALLDWASAHQLHLVSASAPWRVAHSYQQLGPPYRQSTVDYVFASLPLAPMITCGQTVCPTSASASDHGPLCAEIQFDRPLRPLRRHKPAYQLIKRPIPWHGNKTAWKLQREQCSASLARLHASLAAHHPDTHDPSTILDTINRAIKQSARVWSREDLTVRHGVHALETQLRHSWKMTDMIQVPRQPDELTPRDHAHLGAGEHSAAVVQDTITYATLAHHLSGAACEDSAQFFQLLDFCAARRTSLPPARDQQRTCHTADEFADFFSTAVPALDPRVAEDAGQQVLDCMGGQSVARYDDAIFDAHWQVQLQHRQINQTELHRTINPDEVLQAIKSSNSNKAADLQNIRSDLIPATGEVAELLASLLNTCVERHDGILPLVARTAVGKPLSKIRGQPPTPSTCRIIMFNPWLAKLLSQIVATRLQSMIPPSPVPRTVTAQPTADGPWTYVDTAAPQSFGISCNQSGFVRSRTATEHVAAITELMRMQKQRNQDLYIVSCDLRRAFDSVAHAGPRGIIRRLEAIGVDPHTVKLLRMSTLNQKYCVKHDKSKSETHDVHRGVIQGQIASPLIFSVMLNHVLTAVSSLHDRRGRPIGGVTIGSSRIAVLAFADDVLLVSSNREHMRMMLEAFTALCRFNHLSLNPTKTTWAKVVHGRPERVVDYALDDSLVIDGVVIQRVDVMKYLGIDVHDQLSLAPFIRARVRGANAVTHGYFKLVCRQPLPIHAQVLAMKTKHWPVLEFGLDVYGQYLDTDSSDKLRREYLRAIFSLLHVSYRGYGWGGDLLCFIVDCPTWEARLDAIAVRFYSNVLAEAHAIPEEDRGEAPRDDIADEAAGERAMEWLRSRPQGQLWIESFVLHIQHADLLQRPHNTRNPPPPVYTSVVGRLHNTLAQLGWASSATTAQDHQLRHTASGSVWAGDHVHAHLNHVGQTPTREHIMSALPKSLAAASNLMVKLCNQVLGLANSSAPKWSRTFRKRVSKAVYCMHRSRTLTRMLAAVEADSIFSPAHHATMMPTEESPTAVVMGQSESPVWSSDVIVASDHRQGIFRTWWSRQAAADHAEAEHRLRQQLPSTIADARGAQVGDDSNEDNDRRAVWWNMYVLHANHKKHPYLDGIRTSRNDLLRRELRNGIAPGQLSYECPFCGFTTPFLVQHWLVHNNTSGATHPTCTSHRNPSPDCRACIEQRFRNGCRHPGVKYGARLFWAAVLRCTATLLNDSAHPVRVTIVRAYRTCSGWPGTRRILEDAHSSLPMRLVSNGSMDSKEVSPGWDPGDISRLHQQHKASIRSLLTDPKYSSLRDVHSCRRAVASIVHYWHSCIEVLRGLHGSVPTRQGIAAMYKCKHLVRLKLLANQRASSRELYALSHQLAAQLPIQIPRNDLQRCALQRLLQTTV